MDDSRVWNFEHSLWVASPDDYRAKVDGDCQMVLPHPPYVLSGQAAIQAVIDTPRWDTVELTERRVSRPQEGLIVVGYRAEAKGAGAQPYTAYCTSTYRRLEQDHWVVVQHQQTPPLIVGGA